MAKKLLDNNGLAYFWGKLKDYVLANRTNITAVTTQQDGTIVITLMTGDTITVDLNHSHTAYPKYYLCQDEAEYNAIVTKESDTLYLIPETSSSS